MGLEQKRMDLFHPLFPIGGTRSGTSEVFID